MAEHAAGLVGAYVELAHAVARHAPGIIDAYYGPRAWAQAAERSPARLIGDADRLLERLSSLPDLARRAYLSGQVRALRVILQTVEGGGVGFRDEVEALCGVTPEAVPDGRLAGLRAELEELVPGDGDLAERLAGLAAAERVPAEEARPLLDAILAELRRRVRERFPLPDDEHVELRLVRDKPWGGYNTYQGSFTSRVEVNVDLPLDLHALPDLVAHEAYPGHHTEQSIKERVLVGDEGWLEHTLLLLNSPAATVSEGLAETALDTVFGRDELRAWLADELAPMARVPAEAAVRMHDAAEARGQLVRDATANVAMMLYGAGAGDDEAIAYLQEQALATRQEAEHTLRFLRQPRAGSYAFAYPAGRALLERLFAFGEREAWVTRVLSEAVTPGAIRSWIEAAEAAEAAGGPPPGVAGERGRPPEGAGRPAQAEAVPRHAARPEPSPPPGPSRPARPARAAPEPSGTGLAAPDAAAPARARPPLRDLTPVLADLEVELGGTLGVAAWALDDTARPVPGTSVAYRVDEAFPAASTIKVFVLHAMLEAVAAGEAALDEELVLRPSDPVTGSGVLKALTTGRAYTLRDLATLMIVVSDNTAANMLIRRLGVERVNAAAAARGWTSTTLTGLLQRPEAGDGDAAGGSTTSPHDLADYFASLWAGELLPAEATALARSIYGRQQLTQQLGRFLPFDRISAEEGRRPIIASKSGSLRGVRNDAGVVEADAGRFVLAVMTRGCPDQRFHLDNRGSLVVSKVSRLLYQRFARG